MLKCQEIHVKSRTAGGVIVRSAPRKFYLATHRETSYATIEKLLAMSMIWNNFDRRFADAKYFSTHLRHILIKFKRCGRAAVGCFGTLNTALDAARPLFHNTLVTETFNGNNN